MSASAVSKRISVVTSTVADEVIKDDAHVYWMMLTNRDSFSGPVLSRTQLIPDAV